MDIEIQLPREAEGDVEFDQKNRAIKITPYFAKPRELRALLHVLVRGKSGNVRKATIQVSGSSGRVIATGAEVDGVESLFDSGKPAVDDDDDDDTAGKKTPGAPAAAGGAA